MKFYKLRFKIHRILSKLSIWILPHSAEVAVCKCGSLNQGHIIYSNAHTTRPKKVILYKMYKCLDCRDKRYYKEEEIKNPPTKKMLKGFSSDKLNIQGIKGIRKNEN